MKSSGMLLLKRKPMMRNSPLTITIMKERMFWLVVILLFVTNAVSFRAGAYYQKDLRSVKDYQAACVLNDCCRNMVDNIGVDAEEIYCEYIDNLDCDPGLIIRREDMKDYYWSY